MTTLLIALAALIGTMLSPIVWVYGALRSGIDPAYRARCEAKRLGSGL